MRYHLKHLVELYVEYMKLALGGVVLSAIGLTFYSVTRTSSLFNMVALVVIFLSTLVLVVVKWRRRITQKKELRDLELRESDRRERKAKEERLKERIEEAQKFLAFMKAHSVKDSGESTEESLVNDVATLLERLHAENVSQPLIEEAIDRFLTILDEADHRAVRAVRRKILNSIVTEILMNRENNAEERKFVS